MEADGFVEFSTCLHAIDHLMRATITSYRRVKIRLALFATRNDETGQITIA